MQEEYSFESQNDAYWGAIEDAEMHARLRYRPARRFDTGRTSVEDAPLFGGDRQAEMFSDLDSIDDAHDRGAC